MARYASTGANGSGKSNLLDAICFACACSPATLGVRRLTDLQCTDTKEVCHLLATDAYCFPQQTGASLLVQAYFQPEAGHAPLGRQDYADFRYS